jgi:hypothetical protein
MSDLGLRSLGLLYIWGEINVLTSHPPTKEDKKGHNNLLVFANFLSSLCVLRVTGEVGSP